ncbi:hypothetical protein INR49_029679 [Caranx melampygus]|nr:hypothetical protein INR49_029679 [Caranx melampygus]
MNAILIDQPLVCIPRLTYLPFLSRALLPWESNVVTYRFMGSDKCMYPFINAKRRQGSSNAITDSLSSQGCPCVKQLIGNHGSDCGFAWIGHSSTVVLGLGSLAGPDCLSHLWHHWQDTCRQLLVTQIRQPEVLLLRTFKGIQAYLAEDGEEAVPPLGANESTQLPKGEVWVSSFDDCSHFTAEQDVAAHVDLSLGPSFFDKPFTLGVDFMKKIKKRHFKHVFLKNVQPPVSASVHVHPDDIKIKWRLLGSSWIHSRNLSQRVTVASALFVLVAQHRHKQIPDQLLHQRSDSTGSGVLATLLLLTRLQQHPAGLGRPDNPTGHASLVQVCGVEEEVSSRSPPPLTLLEVK